MYIPKIIADSQQFNYILITYYYACYSNTVSLTDLNFVSPNKRSKTKQQRLHLSNEQHAT